MKHHKILVWFRNDLRLNDNEVLCKAIKNSEYIVPFYCFDERRFEINHLGLPNTDSIRAKFLIETVENLKHNLKALGSDLIIRKGNPELIIPELVQKMGITAVYCSKEVTHDEILVEEKLEKSLWHQKIDFITCWTSTLFHLEDLPFPLINIPDIFTDFRKQVEKTTSIRSIFPAPTKLPSFPTCEIEMGDLPQLIDFSLEEIKPDDRAVIDFKGGETEGYKRIETYIWQKSLLKKYKDTRNELLGGDYSSKFSAWLANGSLSPRIIYEEVKKYEKVVVKNESTYWLIFELLWRDYFRFIAKKYGNKIFQPAGLRKNGASSSQKNLKNFQKWKDGETGIPFIDANMVELKHTGFMSNRGRQNVASFLVKDLKINWVYGAMYFESALIDYDVSSNWCNWNYIAGVGNDPRENRYFNIMSQAKRYDPKGEYVKYWLPALKNLPSNKIHHLSEITKEEQKQADCIIGKDYPKSIVPFEKWLERN